MDKLLENSPWPLAIVIIAVFFFLMFRLQISGAIDRFRGASFGNKSLDVSGNQASGAVEKQKQMEGPIGAKAVAAPDTAPASHRMPPSSDVYGPVEHQIRTALTGAKLSSDLEKAWLIRSLAEARIQRGHEMVYRLVLGSQINLILLANTANPPTIERAREIFEQAKLSFPTIYTKFEFDAWKQFPINVGLLRTDTTTEGVSIFRITPVGRDFLHYLVDNTLTEGKAG